METPRDNQTEGALSNSVTGFTAPLGLVDQLKRPSIKLDVVPILDMLVIALLMSLLFTRFVVVPGVRVDLPETELRMPHHDAKVAVLTIGNKGMLYFDGSVYEQNSIERAFKQHIEQSDVDSGHVLLVKPEATMPLQAFLELCRMAQVAGFEQVQIAGEKKEERIDIVPVDSVSDRQQLMLPVM